MYLRDHVGTVPAENLHAKFEVRSFNCFGAHHCAVHSQRRTDRPNSNEGSISAIHPVHLAGIMIDRAYTHISDKLAVISEVIISGKNNDD